MKNKHKKPNLALCEVCQSGICCRQGVEVDLYEVAHILKRGSAIRKPWFRFQRVDKTFPSGFVFSTTLRHGRCVFQNRARRCTVYDIRPRFCREFPLEDGKTAPYYHLLCHHAKPKRRRA